MEESFCVNFFRIIVAKIEPEKLCHTLKIAPGIVASGYCAKCVLARADANAEFCIPTSIAMAVRFGLSKRNNKPAIYPIANPKTL